jgi:hypothetical protein
MTKEGLSKLIKAYLGYPDNVYTYELIRDKAALGLGTMSLEDFIFIPWDEYDIDALADYIVTVTQAPYVLKLDEIVPGMIVYYESKDGDTWIAEVIEDQNPRHKEDTILLYGCNNKFGLAKSNYGKSWRLWSERPDSGMMVYKGWDEE